jgi:hypothetical protein
MVEGKGYNREWEEFPQLCLYIWFGRSKTIEFFKTLPKQLTPSSTSSRYCFIKYCTFMKTIIFYTMLLNDWANLQLGFLSWWICELSFVDYHSLLVADAECLLLHMLLCMAVHDVSGTIILFFVCCPAGQIVEWWIRGFSFYVDYLYFVSFFSLVRLDTLSLIRFLS